MAKRRAEVLMDRVPFKSLLCEPPLLLSRAVALERSPRSEETSVSRAVPKRKLEKVEAPPGKQPGLGGSSLWGKQDDVGDRWRGGPAESQGERTAEGGAGGRGKEWGADQDLDGEAAPGAKTSSRTDTTETEMES
ncbi:hypothetical protein QYF61_016367 [Mycteria americana]|uniref:Uncharacterized protein n=1 Tax=Mycteria americana TaxID=33587 RepID=A0AAN7RW83_MYCAM|nr:hypothetical protein QYF61_016367 [Mycteria americana]